MGNVEIGFLNNVRWEEMLADGIALADGEVHLYRISICRHISLLGQLSATLTPAEILRGNKYLHQRDRDRFVVSRGAQRYILAKYVHTSPNNLQFITGENKKPYLLNADGKGLQYNLSHSGDLILLAVASTAAGCDVEHIDDNFGYRDILPEHFSDAEAAYINQQNHTERFYTLWTRKEALLKATAQGLGDHLRHTPALEGQHPMHTSLTGRDNDWQITSFKPHPDYAASVATQGGTPSLHFWEANLKTIG